MGLGTGTDLIRESLEREVRVGSDGGEQAGQERELGRVEKGKELVVVLGLLELAEEDD